MALSFSVFNKFKAIDGVTAPFKRMGKSAGKFGRKTVKAFKMSDRQASKFSKTLKGIFVGAAIIGGIALLQQGVRSVTEQFIQFDDSIFAAGARFKDIGPDVDNFLESIVDIKKAARDAGATTEFTATQSAQALDFLARAGFSSAEAIGSLGSMINLATASGEDFSRVADISSDLLGAFGLNADNTAQKIKNLNRLNDVLVKTVNSANVTVEDMFETMKQVGPVATGILGASLEEVAALTAVLGSSGIKGSEAMTALKNAYLRLAAPTSEARKLMDALQISIDDGNGGARRMTDIMSELGGKISGLGKVQQAEVLDVLFGKRAIAGGKNIIDNIKNIKKFEKAILNAGGTSQRTADIMRKSLGNRLKALASAATEFGFKILENFEVRGKNAITGFTEALRDMNPQPIIDVLDVLAKFSIKTATFIKNNIGFILFLGKVLGIFLSIKAAIIAVNIVVGLFTGLMALNPIGLFIVGMTALIVGIKAIIDNWDVLMDRFASFDAKSFFGFVSREDEARGAGLRNTPVSPNAGIINTVRQETENRSMVDVNFNNLPNGTDVQQTGNAPGFNLNMGFSGGA